MIKFSELRLGQEAAGAYERVIDACAKLYDRKRDLPRDLEVVEHQHPKGDPWEETQYLVGMLRERLESFNASGWRHTAWAHRHLVAKRLRIALKAEEARLEKEKFGYAA